MVKERLERVVSENGCLYCMTLCAMKFVKNDGRLDLLYCIS